MFTTYLDRKNKVYVTLVEDTSVFGTPPQALIMAKMYISPVEVVEEPDVAIALLCSLLPALHEDPGILSQPCLKLRAVYY